jgi:hypothetical protein
MTFQPTFADLPDDIDVHHGPRRKWQPLADLMRSQPGQWMIVAENDYTSTTSKINNGEYPAFAPKGAFEAKSYKTYPGTTPSGGKATRCERVYARYLPDGDPTPAEVAPAPQATPQRLAEVKKPLPPFKRAASALAQFHAEDQQVDWAALPIEQRGMRAEVAEVALRAVWGLVGSEMTTTIKAVA